MTRPGAYSSWGGRQEYAKTARPLTEPYALAPPAPAVLPLSAISDIVPASAGEPIPRVRMSIVLAEEPSMGEAETKARAADFAEWRARHRRQHRN